MGHVFSYKPHKEKRQSMLVRGQHVDEMACLMEAVDPYDVQSQLKVLSTEASEEVWRSRQTRITSAASPPSLEDYIGDQFFSDILDEVPDYTPTPITQLPHTTNSTHPTS